MGNKFSMGLIPQLLALRRSTYVDLRRHVNTLIARSTAHSALSQPYSPALTMGLSACLNLNTTHFKVIKGISPEKHYLRAALCFCLYQKQPSHIIFWDAAVYRNQVVRQIMYKQTCKSLGCLWKQVFFCCLFFLVEPVLQQRKNPSLSELGALLLLLFSLVTSQRSMFVIMHIRQPNKQV